MINIAQILIHYKKRQKGLLDRSNYNTDMTTEPLFLVELSGGPAARAVAVTTVGGSVTSLLHHADETPASLNYKRALVSLLTPAHHSLSLVYHTQVTLLFL